MKKREKDLGYLNGGGLERTRRQRYKICRYFRQISLVMLTVLKAGIPGIWRAHAHRCHHNPEGDMENPPLFTFQQRQGSEVEI